MLFSLYVVAFAHGCSYLRPGLSPRSGEQSGLTLCLWKNKTTKTCFVAEFHSLIMNNILSPYFFLVVFFAFFAGAFFVAMYSSPPFILGK
jgi:hypothetical protein